jgi:O-antigen/teichoic acid export membrane protein
MIMAASTLVNCGILALSLRKFVPDIPAPSLVTIKRLSRESIPSFLWSAFAIVYYRVDAIMLSIMTPAPVVGWYGASYRFFDVLMFLPSIYTAALFPIASRLWREQRPAHMVTTQKSLEFIVIAGIPMTVLVFTFAEHIIEFFFGLGEYAQSVIVLKVFSLGLLLVYVDFVLGATVLAADRQRSWSLVGLLAIPLNIGLNFLFIPHFQSLHGNGGIGAAIATVLTEAYILAAALVILPDSARQMPRMSVIAKSCVAGTIMSVALLLTPVVALWWMLAACLSLVLYVAVLAVLRPFAQHEVQIARTLFSVHNFRQLFLKQEGETL